VLFPQFKVNARVKLAKMGHGPHSSTLVVICVVRLLFVLFYVLFVFYVFLCSMYCLCSMHYLCVNVYCHRVTTQLQLINIISYLQEDNCINLIKATGHVMHQQFNIQQLYTLPTLYLCVLYLSENKQRLVPLTA